MFIRFPGMGDQNSTAPIANENGAIIFAGNATNTRMKSPTLIIVKNAAYAVLIGIVLFIVIPAESVWITNYKTTIDAEKALLMTSAAFVLRMPLQVASYCHAAIKFTRNAQN